VWQTDRQTDRRTERPLIIVQSALKNLRFEEKSNFEPRAAQLHCKCTSAPTMNQAKRAINRNSRRVHTCDKSRHTYRSDWQQNVVSLRCQCDRCFMIESVRYILSCPSAHCSLRAECYRHATAPKCHARAPLSAKH